MPKMTEDEQKAAVRGMARLLVDQHFGQVIEQLGPGVRALAAVQPPALRGAMVEGLFQAIGDTLTEAGQAIAAEFSAPAELKDADRVHQPIWPGGHTHAPDVACEVSYPPCPKKPA